MAAVHTYSPDRVLQVIRDLPEFSCCLIAYSGGLDSSVLLHSLCRVREQLDARLVAVHINHGLYPDAPFWARHCRDTCLQLGIEFEEDTIGTSPPPGVSMEAWARTMRYRLLERRLNPGNMLVTAHHEDDQAETLLLQLLRGAGPRGLSAMPVSRRFGAGWLVRPLLHFTRAQLREYARSTGIEWIEDTSNRDTGHDRNYLRHAVMPVLRRRWPGIARTLSRAASHQAEAAALLDDCAARDLRELLLHDGRTLSVPGLRDLEPARRNNLLRHWLHTLRLPPPDTRRLRHIVGDVIQAGPDARACVAWKGVEVRRYRDRLFAMIPMAGHDSAARIRWRLTEDCTITDGVLSAVPGQGAGVRAASLPDDRAEVRFRRGGERIAITGKRHHELKKLFQERGVPPWYRDRVPLVFVEDELICIPGLQIAHGHQAVAGEASWRLVWDAPGLGLYR